MPKISRALYVAIMLTLVVGKTGVELAWYGDTTFRLHFALWPAISMNLPPAHVAAYVILSLITIVLGYWVTLLRTETLGFEATGSLLFFVPIVNLFQILAYSVTRDIAAPRDHTEWNEQFYVVMQAYLAIVLIGVVMTIISVDEAKSYGAALFCFSPFVYGCLIGYLVNRKRPQSIRKTLVTTTFGLTLLAGVIFMLAMEGILCLAMAAPLAFAMGALGAIAGRAFADAVHGRTAVVVMLVALPIAGAVDRPAQVTRTVTTSIEIAAPPEKVWRYIVDVPAMPQPTEFLFRHGISFPTSARRTTGTERECVFNTGIAKETITALEPLRRLKFHINSQPAEMREWSWKPDVDAPHLHGYVQSEDGEFTLTRLPNGHTRLEGKSWYSSTIAPGIYWSLFADYFVHMIHHRVLTHIKQLSEMA